MIARNQKFISGILLLIVGGTIIVTGIVFTVANVVNGNFDSLHSFPVSLSTLVREKTAGSFSVPSRTMLSLWLKVPDCRIEGRDFQLSVKIIDDISGEVVLWKNTFSNSMIHNNDAEGQYYLLGIHYFNNNFSGKINYSERGSWVAPYNGYLVVRKPKIFSIPAERMAFLIAGIMLSIIGVTILGRRDNTGK
jgi:hypothetical protein